MVTSLGAGSPRRALVVGSAVTVSCSLPVFFTGAMAVQLRADLGFGTVGIGGATAVFFGTMAVTSVHLGRLVDRLGATLSLRISAMIVAVATLGISTLASSWYGLASGMVVSGVAAALAQPAANRLLMNRVRFTRLGTAFGFKQSAPPVASMLAGLSVPAVAVTVGWRWAYVLVAALATFAAVAVGPRPENRPVAIPRGRRGKPEPLRDRRTLVVLATGFGMAFVASSAALSFFVDAAVVAGMSPSAAGLVFAAGSVGAVVTRLIAGAAADRLTFRPLRLSAGLLIAGAIGLGLLATQEPAVMVVGAVIALAGTWGFPGLFWFALVSAYPDTPGRITGAMAPAATGGIIGPVGFGAVAANASYPLAWSLAGLLALLAAAALLGGTRRLDRERDEQDEDDEDGRGTAG